MSREVRRNNHSIGSARESKSRAKPHRVKRKNGHAAKAKTGFCANPDRMTASPGERTREHSRGAAHMQGPCRAVTRIGCLAIALSLLAVACSGEPEPEREPQALHPSDASVLIDDSEERAAPPRPPTGLRDEFGFSPSAHFETDQMLREDLAAIRHPSDGGGKAWMASYQRADGSAGPLQAGQFGRFEMVYEAGPLGIEVGGQLHFQVSSFWEWDSPQNLDPNEPGYTEARTDAPGVELELDWYGSPLLAIVIRGRKLEAGERIEITYGAGPLGARGDGYAERGAQLWFAVDGDGDGVRKFLDNPPRVDIAPGPADQLLVVMPTSLHPGESFDAFISIVDDRGSAGVPFDGLVELQVPAEIDLPTTVTFAASDAGRKTISGVAKRAGLPHRSSSTGERCPRKRNALRNGEPDAGRVRHPPRALGRPPRTLTAL